MGSDIRKMGGGGHNVHNTVLWMGVVLDTLVRLVLPISIRIGIAWSGDIRRFTCQSIYLILLFSFSSKSNLPLPRSTQSSREVHNSFISARKMAGLIPTLPAFQNIVSVKTPSSFSLFFLPSFPPPITLIPRHDVNLSFSLRTWDGHNDPLSFRDGGGGREEESRGVAEGA